MHFGFAAELTERRPPNTRVVVREYNEPKIREWRESTSGELSLAKRQTPSRLCRGAKLELRKVVRDLMLVPPAAAPTPANADYINPSTQVEHGLAKNSIVIRRLSEAFFH